MTKPWHWLVAGLLVVGLVVLSNYPVYWVQGKLAEATGGRLRVLHSDGTVWGGQAVLGLSDGGRVYTLPDALEWRLSLFEQDKPFGIVASHPRLSAPLHLGFNFEGISLGNGELRVPAAWLSALGAPFNTIRPEGLLKVTWKEMGLMDPDVNVQVLWQDAQSALASIRPLGEYRIELTGKPSQRLDLALSTLNGALKMQGRGSMVPGSRMNFTGEAWSDANNKAALTGLLSQMGRLEGERYKLGVF